MAAIKESVVKVALSQTPKFENTREMCDVMCSFSNLPSADNARNDALLKLNILHISEQNFDTILDSEELGVKYLNGDFDNTLGAIECGERCILRSQIAVTPRACKLSPRDRTIPIVRSVLPRR